jgi:hypothetical protein
LTTKSAAAFLLAETSASVPILTLGCTTGELPAALTVKDEANALVMRESPMAADVTAESSFFICAFPFRAYSSYFIGSKLTYLVVGSVTR